MATLEDILRGKKFNVDAVIPTGDASATTSDGSSTVESGSPISANDSGSGNDTRENGAINPNSANTGINEPSTSYRGRGRKTNSRSKSSNSSNTRTTSQTTREETPPINLDALLVTVHKIISGICSAPEFEIDENEARALSVSLKQITILLTKKKLTPMQRALGTLIVTTAAIYVPRYFIYSARQSAGPIIDMNKPKPNGKADYTDAGFSEVKIGSA